MPAKKSSPNDSKKEKPKAEGKDGGNTLTMVVIIAVVVIAVALGYLVSSGIFNMTGGGGQGSFQGFQTHFYSAPRVAIYVTYLNGSTFSYAAGCAYSMIEKMIESSTNHRNASTIDFLIIANSTSCLAPIGVLGASNGTRVIPISECLATSSHEPSVFINYSATNSTVVRAGNLYTSGDALFLSECGISSELG
jgi:hypothetical protein